MITIALVCLFIACYHSNDNPPVRDVISPLITLSMLLESERGLTGVFLATSALESMADYRMDKYNMGLPICLFSLGHLVRQLAFFMAVNGEKNTPHFLILGATFMLTVVLVWRLYITRLKYTGDRSDGVDISRGKGEIPHDAILYYAMIIFLSAVNVTMIQQIPSWGYLAFIVSDLIIGYEITIRRIHPRWVRVFLVPILYWWSQYLLKTEYLDLREHGVCCSI